MTLRRLAPALPILAALACTPSVPTNPNTSVVTAGFDLTASPPVERPRDHEPSGETRARPAVDSEFTEREGCTRIRGKSHGGLRRPPSRPPARAS